MLVLITLQVITAVTLAAQEVEQLLLVVVQLMVVQELVVKVMQEDMLQAVPLPDMEQAEAVVQQLVATGTSMGTEAVVQVRLITTALVQISHTAVAAVVVQAVIALVAEVLAVQAAAVLEGVLVAVDLMEAQIQAVAVAVLALEHTLTVAVAGQAS